MIDATAFACRTHSLIFGHLRSAKLCLCLCSSCFRCSTSLKQKQPRYKMKFAAVVLLAMMTSSQPSTVDTMMTAVVDYDLGIDDVKQQQRQQNVQCIGKAVNARNIRNAINANELVLAQPSHLFFFFVHQNRKLFGHSLFSFAFNEPTFCEKPKVKFETSRTS